MGIVSNLAYDTAPTMPVLAGLSATLLDNDTLSYDDVTAAETRARKQNVRLETVLFADFGLSEGVICDALAQTHTCRAIDPVIAPPDPRLVARYGASQIAQNHLLPWRRSGDTTVILCTSPTDFIRHSDALTAYFGAIRMALTTPKKLEEAVHILCDGQLIHSAEHQLPNAKSSRGWNSRIAYRSAIFAACLLVTSLVVAPALTVGMVCFGISGLVIANTVLKLAATIAGWGVATAKPGRNAALPARLPTITVLVPLYKEIDIAAHLVGRLQALDYPRALLDVCLVLEDRDDTTRNALRRATLPVWIRPIVVPDGTLKTKPRALNYAMTFAHGSIIGVYDAEDAPAPDQLITVAHHFANCRRDVACLQGTLDYYNPNANWLTRCFTLEYASWFRVILPGFARLGLVVPLGGTTLFFRRDILEKLGGWDAHNVTEDADLGVRLARGGYRTEFMASVTEEEANGRMWPWVKQRSRWLKGYAITYSVHMRNPLTLLRDLGAWKFFGVQMLFLGTLLQFALAPVVWSFWVMPFGITHPMQMIAPVWLVWTFAICFFLTGLINFWINALGVCRAGKPKLIPWALTLQFYFPLAVAAVYKGLLELTWKPFYWDKTAHGILMPTTLPPQPLPRPISDAQQKLH